jgi:hypothetical protein
LARPCSLQGAQPRQQRQPPESRLQLRLPWGHARCRLGRLHHHRVGVQAAVTEPQPYAPHPPQPPRLPPNSNNSTVQEPQRHRHSLSHPPVRQARSLRLRRSLKALLTSRTRPAAAAITTGNRLPSRRRRMAIQLTQRHRRHPRRRHSNTARRRLTRQPMCSQQRRSACRPHTAHMARYRLEMDPCEP